MFHVTFYYCGDSGEIKSVREVNCIPVVGDTIFFSVDTYNDDRFNGKFVVSEREFWFGRGGLKTTLILKRI
jgi:hypothetical protein